MKNTILDVNSVKLECALTFMDYFLTWLQNKFIFIISNGINAEGRGACKMFALIIEPKIKNILS